MEQLGTETGAGWADALQRLVRERSWYHTLDFGGGLLTPGWFDTRRYVGRLPFPERLDGMRCLDVGTFDGFWAFEMERRGATEVVAIDVLDPAQWDWPADASAESIALIGERHAGGVGFEVARQVFDSKVERIGCSVYDLDPDEIGEFDFVYVGSLLVHLRDPVQALQRIRQVCRGRVLLVGSIDLALTLRSPRTPLARLDARGRPWWWTANQAAVIRMAEAAGFALDGPPVRAPIPAGAGQGPLRVRPRTLRHRAGREALLRRAYGEPHLALPLVPAV